ncbi:MAG: tRNA isopentenyl-2-thiomethyl-A-37 hydroxylase MiaE [Planctomycetota bacterium]|nr:tRNA isopentenyl-2-thiomethyl-A-37 hydroxylase MiaE [Planctomycetota bacterium]
MTQALPESDQFKRQLSQTPASWATESARDLMALLSDHAHCELKAGANAMTMLKRNPNRPGFALRLAPLIKEECDHLHRVLREIEMRGGVLAQDAPNPWAEGLHAAARKLPPVRLPHGGFLDVLLISALIEMRSHERFERLAECAAMRDLESLYRNLCEAEARHGLLFQELARETFPAAAVEERFALLAEQEAVLMERLPPGPRIHSGVAGL